MCYCSHNFQHHVWNVRTIAVTVLLMTSELAIGLKLSKRILLYFDYQRSSAMEQQIKASVAVTNIEIRSMQLLEGQPNAG